MPTYKSLKEAHGYIFDKINSVLADEVFKTVRKTELDAIRNKVYSAYDPHIYRRRKTDGGLGDPRNIQIEGTTVDGTLVVANVTKPNVNRRSYSTNKRKWKSAETWAEKTRAEGSRVSQYCYANYNQGAVAGNFERHNPLSPLISGEVGEGDRIYDRKVKSCNVAQ